MRGQGAPGGPGVLRAAVLAGAVLLWGCASGGPSVEELGPAGDAPWDLLLVNGRLVDGTGNAWRYADVALSGDRIAAVLPPGTADRERAREVLDVSGHVVAPGFIDLNGQGDSGLLQDGRALNKLFMGVTTEIMGESNTPAPLNENVTGGDPPRDETEARRRLRTRSSSSLNMNLMACLNSRRLGASLRLSLMQVLSYHSIQPFNSVPSVSTTIIVVRPCICLR